jgi:hypothetical protein
LKQLSQLESEDSHIWEDFKFDDFGRKETHELFCSQLDDPSQRPGCF